MSVLSYEQRLSSDATWALADVQELIKRLALTRELAEQLDPYVRDKYCELWDAAKSSPNP